MTAVTFFPVGLLDLTFFSSTSHQKTRLVCKS